MDGGDGGGLVVKQLDVGADPKTPTPYVCVGMYTHTYIYVCVWEAVTFEIIDFFVPVQLGNGNGGKSI